MSIEMITYTVTLLVTSMLGATGSILIAMRIQRWFTLLMTCGVVLALIVRTLMMTVGTLQILGKMPLETYHRYNDTATSVGIVGNLCFAIGFAATAIYLMRFLTPLITKDSTGK
jgi:hypothetical protein